jgi:hypothetical protein
MKKRSADVWSQNRSSYIGSQISVGVDTQVCPYRTRNCKPLKRFVNVMKAIPIAPSQKR